MGGWVGVLSGPRLLMKLHSCHLECKFQSYTPSLSLQLRAMAPCAISPHVIRLCTHVHPTAPRVHLGKSRRSVPGSGPRVPSLGAQLYSESRLLATGGGHNLTTKSGGDSSGVMSTEDPGSGPRTYMVAHNRP